MLLRKLQTRLDDFLVLPGRFYPGRRFLLKGVKHVNRLFKSHYVNRTVGVSIVVIHDLKDARPLACPWLGFWMLASKLGDTGRIADLVFHILGKRQQVAFRGTNPNKRFFSGLSFVATSLSQNGYNFSTGNSLFGAERQGQGEVRPEIGGLAPQPGHISTWPLGTGGCGRSASPSHPRKDRSMFTASA